MRCALLHLMLGRPVVVTRRLFNLSRDDHGHAGAGLSVVAIYPQT
jgi:hypothetical protein